MVETAVAEAVAAIEEDGAEALILGCSAAYWLKPVLQRRLAGLGWDAPVLEGYGCAIAMAKMLVDLGADASGLAFRTTRRSASGGAGSSDQRRVSVRRTASCQAA